MEVNNKSLFGKVYNNLDRVIRFTYCRVPILRDILRKLMFKKLYSSDIRKLDDAYEEMAQLLEKTGFDPKGRTVLELGPGNSYTLAFNFLLSGAKKTVLVDKYPRRFDTNHQKEFLEKEIKFFKKKYNRSLKGIITKAGKANKAKILSIKASAEKMRTVKTDSSDIIVSISVLEHIKDLEKAFREMHRVLKPGGLMIHKIDLRDHYNFNKPLMFLKYSKKTWENWMTKEGYSYTNRLRADDIIKMVKYEGFKVVKTRKDKLQKKVDYNNVHKDYTGKDLRTLNLDVVLKKK